MQDISKLIQRQQSLGSTIAATTNTAMSATDALHHKIKELCDQVNQQQLNKPPVVAQQTQSSGATGIGTVNPTSTNMQ